MGAYRQGAVIDEFPVPELAEYAVYGVSDFCAEHRPKPARNGVRILNGHHHMRLEVVLYMMVVPCHEFAIPERLVMIRAGAIPASISHISLILCPCLNRYEIHCCMTRKLP